MLKWLPMVASVAILLAYTDGIVFGHMYIYQSTAGLLLVILLAQYTIPAIACPDKLTDFAVATGNVIIASLPFLAIWYLPASVVLFFASYRKEFAVTSLRWLIGAASLNFAFLCLIGSLSGYIADHVYLNYRIMPIYNGGQAGWRLIFNVFTNTTNSIAELSLFLLIAASACRLAASEKQLPWRTLSVCIALVVMGPVCGPESPNGYRQIFRICADTPTLLEPTPMRVNDSELNFYCTRLGLASLHETVTEIRWQRAPLVRKSSDGWVRVFVTVPRPRCAQARDP